MAQKRNIERKERIIEHLKKENDLLKANNVFLSDRLLMEEHVNKRLIKKITLMDEHIKNLMSRSEDVKSRLSNLQDVSELLILLRNDFLNYK